VFYPQAPPAQSLWTLTSPGVRFNLLACPDRLRDRPQQHNITVNFAGSSTCRAHRLTAASRVFVCPRVLIRPLIVSGFAILVVLTKKPVKRAVVQDVLGLPNAPVKHVSSVRYVRLSHFAIKEHVPEKSSGISDLVRFRKMRTSFGEMRTTGLRVECRRPSLSISHKTLDDEPNQQHRNNETVPRRAFRQRGG